MALTTTMTTKKERPPRVLIDVRDLTKRYGPTVAVDRLRFRVEPGRVTGFLGPNGAGKPATEVPTSSAATR